MYVYIYIYIYMYIYIYICIYIPPLACLRLWWEVGGGTAYMLLLLKSYSY